MTSIIERIRRAPTPATTITRSSLQATIDALSYGGHLYPMFGGGGQLAQPEPVRYSLRAAIQGHPIVFSLVDKRAETFSMASFKFTRRSQVQGLPTVADMFTTDALAPLDDPIMVLDRMERDVADSGNAFLVRRNADGLPLHRGMTRSPDDHLFALDPQSVTLKFGVPGAPVESNDPRMMSRMVLLGIIYHPSGEAIEQFLPGEYGHYAPTPDLGMTQRGMSWLESALTEVDTDVQAREYVQSFYVNGATPNLVVTIDPMVAVEAVERIQQAINEEHQGAANAFGTLVLAGGAKPTIVGSKLADLDQEPISRQLHASIAAAAGIPPILAGIPGMSQDTYANTRQATRAFLDFKVRPLLAKAAQALAPLIDVPPGAKLTPDTSTVAAFQDDAADDAEVMAKKATYIRTLTDGGYQPDSVVASAISGQLADLTHTNLLPVQLQPPGQGMTDGPEDSEPEGDETE